MKLTYSILFVFALACTASSQEPITSSVLEGEGLNIARFVANSNNNQLYTFSTKYTGVQGHPYYSESPFYGDIKTKDGTVFAKVPFRYNIYEDLIEYNKEGRTDQSILRATCRIQFHGRKYRERCVPSKTVLLLEMKT